MERLWSTWRSSFIDGHKETQGEESPFVRAWREPEHDAENMMVHRGERAFIIMNKYPYNPGHLLILPGREIADPLDSQQQNPLRLDRHLAAAAERRGDADGRTE